MIIFVLTYTSETYFLEGLTDNPIVFTNVLVFYRVPLTGSYTQSIHTGNLNLSILNM